MKCIMLDLQTPVLTVSMRQEFHCSFLYQWTSKSDAKIVILTLNWSLINIRKEIF
jgi:hypothetical protein